ncbi:hypothetical protein [uncultured Bacteroides sp.]|uniref:hypothetical protein n=1 Tax=uncultured Bacteroides sp. TaxID=162156 RepID=UPI0026204888|nr:hypothetical protein [uncultured Bacteroides sp.]
MLVVVKIAKQLQIAKKIPIFSHPEEVIYEGEASKSIILSILFPNSTNLKAYFPNIYPNHQRQKTKKTVDISEKTQRNQ